MGLLTDFVVADPADAPRVGASSCPCRDFDGVRAKGVDTVKIGKLYSILTGRPYDRTFMGGGTLRFEASAEGPWVFEVPADLVLRLARLGPEGLPPVAAAWSKIEEFSPKYDNWPASAVREVLDGVAALCRRAAAENKAVFLWMCL